MSNDNCREALETVRVSQVGLCKRLAQKIAVAAVSNRTKVILIGEQLEDEQDVLYAIDAALRCIDTNATF